MRSKLTYAARWRMVSRWTRSKKCSCRSRSTASESPKKYSRRRGMSDGSIGFIGVGRMGGKLARRLIDAGKPLTIFDTNAGVVREFVELGARSVQSATAVGSECEIVITCLP